MGPQPRPARRRVSVHYLAFYLTTDRWQKATLTVTGEHPVQGVAGRCAPGSEQEGCRRGQSRPLRGRNETDHRQTPVVLRTMVDPEIECDWKLGLTVTPEAEAGAGSLEPRQSPPSAPRTSRRSWTRPRISRSPFRPTADLAAISLGEYRNGDDQEQWLEIRDTEPASWFICGATGRPRARWPGIPRDGSFPGRPSTDGQGHGLASRPGHGRSPKPY